MAERESGRPESDATIALLSVTLDRQGGQSLVRQLYLHLRELILTRRIAVGAATRHQRSSVIGWGCRH